MTNTEKIFAFIDTHAQASDSLYLEAVIEACNYCLTGKSMPELPTPATQEEIRRGIQLAILKGMKENAQRNHQMTPDSIGMLLGHIASKLVKDYGATSILDPTVGTGNLLYTIMNMMNVNVTAYAVEIDEVLVRLSAVIAEILEHRVTFLVQDALRPLFID